MALKVPNYDQATYPPQSALDTSDIGAIAAGIGRTGVLTGCAVTQRGAGANMSVDVAAGTVAVSGVAASISAANKVIGAADATNPRIDLVVSSSAGVLSVIAGTAAASPEAPESFDPATQILLAAVYVPANATTVVTAQIIDKRVILGSVSAPIFGDGVDGDVTISSNSTLTVDMAYNNLTINAGVTLNVAGARILVRNSLTNNGTIAFDGVDGGLVQVNGLTLPAGAQGGFSGTTTGSNGGTPSVGGAGKLGGNGGNGGSGSGGAGGTGTSTGAPDSGNGGTKAMENIGGGILYRTFYSGSTPTSSGGVGIPIPGGGGGQGGSDGTGANGVGGQGGGVVVVVARHLAGTGTIRAKGGAGLSATAGNRGGGGGGGGGVIVLVTADTTNPYTLDVSGGTFGTGFGTGTSGTAGSTGRTFVHLGA